MVSMYINIIYNYVTTTQTGTYLKAANGNDWQLFLMNKQDMYTSNAILAPPISIFSGQYQPITLPHNLLSNPVELYSYYTSNKCPNIFHPTAKNINSDSENSRENNENNSNKDRGGATSGHDAVSSIIRFKRLMP